MGTHQQGQRYLGASTSRPARRRTFAHVAVRNADSCLRPAHDKNGDHTQLSSLTITSGRLVLSGSWISGTSSYNFGVSFTTPSQLLLLRGALSNGQEAVAAAEEWLRLYGCGAGPAFRSLEAGSRRLLPLLYQNSKESVCKDYRAPLREVYLEYWAKNQKLLNGL